MSSVELIICLLVLTAGLAWLASRVKVPYPIFLTLAGLAISVLPRVFPGHLKPLELNPEIVFLIFLPPLLYYAGLLTSWRDFKANLRPISLLAVGLVLFTTCLVAMVAHYLVGLDWAPAFVLGAIVSPPDAVAATAITQRLRIPKRIVTILEGESLVNDASALIAYSFAVMAVKSGEFSATSAGIKFFVSSAGGVAVGYVVGRFMAWLRPRLHDSSVEGMFALLIPYIAYLPAEWLHVSGVLSVVTAGVYVGRRLPEITTSQHRLRLYAVWDTLVFLLNGLIFILIGLQLPAVIERLDGTAWSYLVGSVVVIGLTAIVVRIVWVIPAAYLPRLLKSIRNREPKPDPRQVFLVSWVGLRGIVSLAAALALPLVTNQGTPFPGRDLIIFITFGVILITLVGQGLTLPLVIKFLRIKPDDIEEREEETARLQLANAALMRLQVLAITNEDAQEVIDRVRQPYEERLAFYGPRRRGIEPQNGDVLCRTTDEVTRVALHAEREMLVRLRDEGEISDDVLRKIQMELDLQEAQLDG